MSSKRKRSLSGIKPSGEVHLGNYLGFIKPALRLQNDFDCFYFIADLHALTTNRDAIWMHSCTMDLVATFLALGLDVKKHLFYRQSDVPIVAEYAWYLSCFTGLGLVEKGHALKDARAKEKDTNLGVVSYPVLMAADIVMYEVDVVPVGKDQKQHVEIARDISGSINAHYGKELIKLPEALIEEEVAVIPGLDGQKMSKSYNNVIPLFCDEKTLRKLVLSLKTDSTPLEASKSMKDSTLGMLAKLFMTGAEYTDLEKRLNAGGIGWGHAKDDLFQAINREIVEPRTEFVKLRSDERKLTEVLEEGASRAYQIARPNLNKLREALGFRKS